MNFAKTAGAPPTLASAYEPPERIHDMFPPHSAVALFGAGNPATRACEQVASELFLANRRVVIVPVLTLLHTRPLPNPNLTGARQALDGTFWLWPAARARTFEAVNAQTSQSDLDWMSSLRSNFDLVLLDCPGLETTPRCAAIALMAQSALLAVEANRTSRQQIIQTQHALQSSGIRLDGSILVQNGREQ